MSLSHAGAGALHPRRAGDKVSESDWGRGVGRFSCLFYFRHFFSDGLGFFVRPFSFFPSIFSIDGVGLAIRLYFAL